MGRVLEKDLNWKEGQFLPS